MSKESSSSSPPVSSLLWNDASAKQMIMTNHDKNNDNNNKHDGIITALLKQLNLPGLGGTQDEDYHHDDLDDLDDSASLSPLPFHQNGDDENERDDGNDCNDNGDDYDHDDNDDDDGGDDNDDDNVDDGTHEKALKNMEAQVARELYEMTPQQRSLVFDDVHGVTPLLSESLEFLALKLHEFNNSIIKQGEQAQVMHHEYYSRQSIRLQFLRAAEYDARQATNLLQKFIQCKMDLFGPSSVFRDITIQQDFEPFPQDLKCLQSGLFQIIPSRDQGGRFVIFIYPPIATQFTVQSMSKTMFHVYYSAVANSVENQKSGAVMVTFNVGDNPCTSSAFIKRIKRAAEVRHCLPLRTVAHHMCACDPSQKIYTRLMMLVIGYNYRVRFRAHYGDHSDCLPALQAHGIPRQLLPVAQDGSYSPDNHLLWLESILKQEQGQQEKYLVENMQSGVVPITSRARELTTTTTTTTTKTTTDGCRATSETVLPLSPCTNNSSTNTLPAPTNMPTATTLTTTNIDNNNNNNNTSSNDTTKYSNETTSSCSLKEGKDDVIVLIDLPRYYDVLFGRGRMVTEHPGNHRLHQLVEIYYERYEKSSKADKVNITMEIVSIVHQSKGRFLKVHDASSSHWIEVSEMEARDKVSSTFRNRRALQLKNAKKQQQQVGQREQQRLKMQRK